jgi:alkylation response protein AidB-like acyl-CoA dehydrogenase
VRQQYDEQCTFPWDVVKALAQVDMFRVFIPVEYDGLVEDGRGIVNMCLVTEELSKVCAGIALAFAGTGLGAFPILLYGSDEQKKQYLPKIASGEQLAAFGLTEPAAGSDAGAIRMTAIRDGDEYVLNGTKIFITNGGEADIYTIVALTAPKKGVRGASAFIIEKDTPGFSFGKSESKMGIHASATRELIFEDARVPAANLLGKEGQGFIVAMKTFDISRPGVAAQAVGVAAGAMNEALAYVHQRKQFGKSIMSFQGIQWMFADMIDRGITHDIGHLSAMAKVFASDVAMKVATDAVQVYGGYGYMTEYPVEKMMRDAKITQIYEGTNQIQRNVIGARLMKEASRLVP